MKRAWVVTAVTTAMMLAGSAAAADPVFAYRENVNLLYTNNPDMTVTARYGVLPGEVDNRSYRMYYSADYDTGSLTPQERQDNWLTINFGEVCNVQTIRMMTPAPYAADGITPATQGTPTGFEVWTSSDGVNFTPLPSGSYAYGFEPANTRCTGTITLNSAINTQYLRLVPTGYTTDVLETTSKSRWCLQDLRVFGGVGTLNRGNLNLLSSTGLARGDDGLVPVTMVTEGTISITDPNDGRPAKDVFFDAAVEHLSRKVISSLGVGKSVGAVFDNGLTYDFTTLGVMGYQPNDATFSLAVLTEDGWTPLVDDKGQLLIYDLPGGPVGSQPFEYFPLPAGTQGTGIKLVIESCGDGTDNRIYDLQLFGAPVGVPEPVTMSLLALGGLAMLRRKR